jgi:hypothetical protein
MHPTWQHLRKAFGTLAGIPPLGDEKRALVRGARYRGRMDSSRAAGHPTIGAAVDAYVLEIPGLDRAWAGLNAEELEEIRDMRMSYLFLTRGIG